jgi:cytochrome P450
MDLPAAPVARGSKLLGSALDLRRDMLGTTERAFREHGDVVRLLVGPPGLRAELYLGFHPDAAQRVLGSTGGYRKDNTFYTEIRDAFGDGLLTSQDEGWQRQKRFLQPLFTARRVAGYADAMGAQVDELAEQWQQRPAGMVDLHAEMTRLTLQIVCRVLFGEDVEPVLPVVRRAFGPLGEAVRRRALAPARLPVGWPSPVNRRLVRARQALHAACDEIIARRRAGAAGAEDLLGLLLDARDDGTALADAEVRDQVLIFLLAGHETTSTALTFTLHLLGRHPEAQRRVRAEVEDVVGDRVPTAADALALPYTTMALKEAMRLFPPAPAVGRRASRDDEICGYRIPAGSEVVLMPWVIHRHPQFWDQPGRFDPERFTPEREKARHRYAWFPFGGGPRACIGQHFSMLESVIALAVLVRAVDFVAPATDPACTNHITLRPVAGVPSHITPRRRG